MLRATVDGLGAVLLLTATAAWAAGARTSITKVGVVSVRVTTSANGTVCYQALRPGVRPGHSQLSACVAHLRATEIAFVLATRHTGQQMIAGLRGPRVARVEVTLAPRVAWAPKRARGVFFGYVPSGHRVVAVTKVLDDGTRRLFRVRG